jgi:hypothetical protein
MPGRTPLLPRSLLSLPMLPLPLSMSLNISAWFMKSLDRYYEQV